MQYYAGCGMEMTSPPTAVQAMAPTPEVAAADLSAQNRAANSRGPTLPLDPLAPSPDPGHPLRLTKTH